MYMARPPKPFIKPQLSDLDLGWIAGFLEGEGTFGRYKTNGKHAYARVVCGSSDLDQIERLQTLLGGVGTIHKTKVREGREHHKPFWNWQLSAGKQAEGVMRLVYPHMSPRRQGQIDDALKPA